MIFGGNIPREELNLEKTFSFLCILKISNIYFYSQHLFSRIMRSSVLKAVTSSWNTNGDIRKVISLTCPLLMRVPVYRFQYYFANHHNYENIPMRISKMISRKPMQIFYI